MVLFLISVLGDAVIILQVWYFALPRISVFFVSFSSFFIKFFSVRAFFSSFLLNISRLVLVVIA